MAERVSVTMQPLTQPFVEADYQRCRVGLVVVPSAGIASLPPQHAEPNVIADRATEEHGVFTRRLRDMGVQLEVLPSSPGGLCFAVADLAVVVNRGVVFMRPSDVTRHAELRQIEEKCTELGLPILGRIEAPGLLDGGDVLLSEGTAYIGVPHGKGRHENRSNRLGRESFAEITGLRVVEVPVSASIPRLNSVATLIDASTIVLGAESVDPAPFDGLQTIITPLGEEIGAGMLTLDTRHVLANNRFRETPGLLRGARIKVEYLDLWEFGKLGFSPASLICVIARR